MPVLPTCSGGCFEDHTYLLSPTDVVAGSYQTNAYKTSLPSLQEGSKFYVVWSWYQLFSGDLTVMEKKHREDKQTGEKESERERERERKTDRRREIWI